MNAFSRAAVLPLLLTGLAGCTGMQERSSSAAYVAPQRAPSILDNDDVYIATVERIARRRGIGVVWINPPRKELLAQQGDR